MQNEIYITSGWKFRRKKTCDNNNNKDKIEGGNFHNIKYLIKRWIKLLFSISETGESYDCT